MHERAATASAPPRGEAFPRARRIGARRDFRAAYENGAKVHGRLVVVFALPRPAGGLRLGVTATRKAGGAVARNRARRHIREIFRKWKVAAPESAVDLVVNISARAVQAPYPALQAEVAGLLGRALAAASKGAVSSAAAARGPGPR
jgi:ribonuclease P protein component